MLTVIAFVVALGLLIAIHEYGHYRVAVACGVKVLRFSIGIGKPLLRWKKKGSDTEFVLAMLPLGGYVRMLDSREGEVAEHERHLSFNAQPLRARAAIVAAGPLANLLLAIALYSVVNWVGVQEPKPILAAPVAGSLASAAGLQGQESVQAMAWGGQTYAVQSFEDFRWQLTQAAIHGEDLLLQLDASSSAVPSVTLPLSQLPSRDVDAELMRRIGLLAPWTPAHIGELMAGGAGERAGLQAGDVVQSINGRAVADGVQLRQDIRAAVQGTQAVTQEWVVLREGQQLTLSVTPEVVAEGDLRVGRLGAYVGGAPDMLTVQSGLFEGIARGVQRTWDVAWLSLKMMGRMLIGEASIKNLSGPLTIADYAGKSASLGWIQYLLFLALISVSLGVLNLLPLPVLDGGHLMYYLWEGVTGHPVSDVWMERLQRVGVSLLLVMMSIAFYNDISRLWG